MKASTKCQARRGAEDKDQPPAERVHSLPNPARRRKCDKERPILLLLSTRWIAMESSIDQPQLIKAPDAAKWKAIRNVYKTGRSLGLCRPATVCVFASQPS